MGTGFKKLTTWQNSYILALEVYKLTADFPKHEIFGLSSQLRRASISVSANIAEGYERGYRREYIKFLTIAKGSLGEIQTLLLFSKDLQYVDDERFQAIERLRQDSSKLITCLIRSLNTDKDSSTYTLFPEPCTLNPNKRINP